MIEGLTFKDLGPNVEAIHLKGCNNVTIRANDFARVAQAIPSRKSTNVKIEWNRYQRHRRPAPARQGAEPGQLRPARQRDRRIISHNKGKGGDTEDIISLFRTGGTQEQPFIVEYNHFEGVDWISPSGSGIALGDATSSHSIARYNILLNPGQARDLHRRRDRSPDHRQHDLWRATAVVERGHLRLEPVSDPCEANVVRDNKVNWTTEDGSANPAWDAGNCGPIDGWLENDWHAELDPATMEVEL